MLFALEYFDEDGDFNVLILGPDGVEDHTKPTFTTVRNIKEDTVQLSEVEDKIDENGVVTTYCSRLGEFCNNVGAPGYEMIEEILEDPIGSYAEIEGEYTKHYQTKN